MTDRGRLSRRQMIKASAAAGAAAWTAPVIIDSLASPAAAASGCSGPSVTLSWIYVLYTIGGNYYITGFSNGATACGGGGSNPASHGTLCAPCGANSLTINTFTGTPPNPASSNLTFTTAGACGGSQSTNWHFTAAAANGAIPACGTNIVFNNGQIKSQGGATILAAVGFGAGTLRAICPNNSSPGNSVCGIEV